MSYVQDIHDIALASVLEPDDHYYYRTICRKYSEKFHTPLHHVHQLPYHTVLVNYFESVFENMHEDDLDEIVHRAVNPNYDDEEELQDFIQMVEEESEGKRKAKKKKAKLPAKKDKQESIANKQESIVNKQESFEAKQESLMRNPPVEFADGPTEADSELSDPLVDALQDLD